MFYYDLMFMPVADFSVFGNVAFKSVPRLVFSLTYHVGRFKSFGMT